MSEKESNSEARHQCLQITATTCCIKEVGTGGPSDTKNFGNTAVCHWSVNVNNKSIVIIIVILVIIVIIVIFVSSGILVTGFHFKEFYVGFTKFLRAFVFYSFKDKYEANFSVNTLII